MKVEISEDQNTVVISNVKYKAIKSTACHNCAFYDVHDGRLKECSAVPCMRYQRVDRKSVIFKTITRP